MHFRDRAEAGRRLAAALRKYRDRPGIVYPLPRGGVPLALEITRVLHMPIDLVIPRKIGHPYSPEYAVCAVCEHGEPVCNERERPRRPFIRHRRSNACCAVQDSSRRAGCRPCRSRPKRSSTSSPCGRAPVPALSSRCAQASRSGGRAPASGARIPFDLGVTGETLSGRACPAAPPRARGEASPARSAGSAARSPGT